MLLAWRLRVVLAGGSAEEDGDVDADASSCGVQSNLDWSQIHADGRDLTDQHRQLSVGSMLALDGGDAGQAGCFGGKSLVGVFDPVESPVFVLGHFQVVAGRDERIDLGFVEHVLSDETFKAANTFQ